MRRFRNQNILVILLHLSTHTYHIIHKTHMFSWLSGFKPSQSNLLVAAGLSLIIFNIAIARANQLSNFTSCVDQICTILIVIYSLHKDKNNKLFYSFNCLLLVAILIHTKSKYIKTYLKLK